MLKKNNIGLIAGLLVGAAIGVGVGVALYRKAKADEIETIYVDDESCCCNHCHCDEETELEH